MGDLRDPAGLVQPPPPATWNIPAAPALSPEAALKSFRLPAGFRIELVASEPLIGDPVALDFDAQGRLWVVEMRSYMPDIDGRGEGDRINQVVVLEDTDGDGRMDKRSVYMDGLGLVRAIKVLERGVIIADPPNLWLTRDTDGDGRADEKQTIATDFSLAEMNPELGPNSLVWGLDNWLSAAEYGRRWRLADGKWISQPAAIRGQWGQTMDDFGRLYTNSSESYLRTDLISHHYPARNPQVVPPPRGERTLSTGVNYPSDPDQAVWPSRVTAGVNRGYWETQLRKDGTLATFTAACGPAIYRGDNFPAAYQGNYFAAEPCAHLVRRSILVEGGGVVTGRNAYTDTEFLTSSDERFRPVNLYSAPDGTLYVVDMYRGLVQHREFMTTFLRRQIVERKLDKPIGYGRIYRIVHEDRSPGPQPRLARLASAELVETLSHANGWWRDTAQRILVERGDQTIVPAVRRLARSDAALRTRLHAAWTLEGLGALDRELVHELLRDAEPKLRAAALRFSEPWLRPDEDGLLAAVKSKVVDPDPAVRWQLALSVGAAPVPQRISILEQVLRAEGESPFLIFGALSSVAGAEIAFLEHLLASSAWRAPRSGAEALFAQLAATVFRGGDEAAQAELLQRIELESEPKWRRLALLSGIAASNVRKLSIQPISLQAVARSSEAEVAARAGELLAQLNWPGKFPLGAAPLTTAEKELIAHGRTVYERSCAGCHQLNGQGLDGAALPLVGSKWVGGSDRILARIVLKGKMGKSSAMMPPLEMLSNRDLAAALSHVRQSWGHEFPPVLPATVAEMRRAIIVRSQPYTDGELELLTR